MSSDRMLLNGCDLYYGSFREPSKNKVLVYTRFKGRTTKTKFDAVGISQRAGKTFLLGFDWFICDEDIPEEGEEPELIFQSLIPFEKIERTDSIQPDFAKV